MLFLFVCCWLVDLTKKIYKTKKQFLQIQAAVTAHLCISLWIDTGRVSHKIALWAPYSRYCQFANEMSWPEISSWIFFVVKENSVVVLAKIKIPWRQRRECHD